MTRRAHPRTPTRGRQPTRRGTPHLPVDDPANPGCCLTCHRPTGAKSDRHLDQLPTTDPDTLAEERRRLGEHE